MKRLSAAAALIGIVVTGSIAHAQSQYTQSQLNSFTSRTSAQAFTSERMRSSVINRAVPQYSFSNVNRGILSGATGPKPVQRAKPFANAKQGPSTSPYMGLLSQTPFTSSTSNYFNIVKPQLEQQRANEKLQAQNIRLQQQLGEAAAQGPYSTTGSEERAPTGHTAVYMNNGGVYGNPGGYYPQVPIRSVRGQKQ
jgi:hypothetical protein